MKKKIVRILISVAVFLITAVIGMLLLGKHMYKKATAKLMLADESESTTCVVYGTIADVEDTDETSKTYRNAVLGLTYQDYSGDAVITVNGNVPMFTDDEISISSFEEYSNLDNKGRAGVGMACLSKEMQPTAPRDFDLSEVTPSGFINRCYPDLIEEDGWLYHRCHIIGYQLAGETTNELNLFTGTRFLNENGMLWQENAVAQYLRDYPDIHIMYRVTPIFRDNEMVCRGVLMEAYSVEDNGGLQFCVFCYNVQPGIEINYYTGESKVGG